MKRTILIYVFSLICLLLNAQIIENKIDLSVGYGLGFFGGPVTVKQNGFISPSLYSNFERLSGITVKLIFIKHTYFNAGASLGFAGASDWHTNGYSDYNGSAIALSSFSPLIQIHNRIAELGFLNRVRFFLEIAPTIGQSKLTLQNPLFDIQGQSGPVSQPMGSSDLFYGVKTAARIEASLNQVAGVYFEASAGRYHVESKMYGDNHFTDYMLELGILVRFKKNQRFFY